MKIYILLCALFLLGCYDDFYNPNIFQDLAQKKGFVLNGNFSECNGETRIRALHEASGTTGSLRFQKSSWSRPQGPARSQINMYFIADSGQKDAYNTWLIGKSVTTDTVFVQKEKEEQQEPKRFKLSDY